MDPRGVLRGRCTQSECYCYEYRRGTDGIRCFCNHPPGQHENLKKLAQTTPAVSSRSEIMVVSTGTPLGYTFKDVGSYSGSYSLQTCSATNPTANTAQTYASVAGSHSSGHYPPPSQSSHSSHAHLPGSLPCKADDCTNTRHYEYGIGLFDYCSPSCRDKHCLPRAKKKLDDDIKRFKDEITTKAKTEKHTTKKSVTPTRQDLSATTKHGFLIINKSAGKDFGLIISDKLYDSGGVKGYLVIGVKTGTIAYSKLESKELHLLDVITFATGDKESISPHRVKPNVFAEKLKSSKSVAMSLDHDIALPFPAELIKKAVRPSFIFVLTEARHDLGLIVDTNGKYVRACSQNSLPKGCGLQSGDEIVCCSFARKDSIDQTIFSLYAHDLRAAAQFGQSIIIAAKRK